MEILGGLPIIVQQRPVKGEVQFEDTEMPEILFHACHRKHFLHKSLTVDPLGSTTYLVGITLS
jgi:hypothetical protein